MCVQFSGGKTSTNITIKKTIRKKILAKIDKEKLKHGDPDFVDERIIEKKKESLIDKFLNSLFD